jgi:surface protein
VFRDANAFNQPLNSWQVSAVTDMSCCFCVDGEEGCE